MIDATYILKKHRVYLCICGEKPHRPLQASDTRARPFPIPCDWCGSDLSDCQYEIVDDGVYFREMMARKSRKKRWLKMALWTVSSWFFGRGGQ